MFAPLTKWLRLRGVNDQSISSEDPQTQKHQSHLLSEPSVEHPTFPPTWVTDSVSKMSRIVDIPHQYSYQPHSVPAFAQSTQYRIVNTQQQPNSQQPIIQYRSADVPAPSYQYHHTPDPRSYHNHQIPDPQSTLKRRPVSISTNSSDSRICAKRSLSPSLKQPDIHKTTTTARNTEPCVQPSTGRTTEEPLASVEVKQSSLLETETGEENEESNAMWKAALQRLIRLKRSITSLEKSVEAEFQDLSVVDTVVKRSELILHDVCHNLKTANGLMITRQQQLEDADNRFRLLTAEDLSDCSSSNLEDISDVLWSGLQSATLALSRRQDKLLAAGMKESDDCHPMKKQEDLQMSSSNIIPEAKFDPPTRTPPQEMTGKSEQICTQLIELLQTIGETQSRASKHYKKKLETADRLHASILSTNKSYATERENLLTVERKLDTRLRQVNRLTGRGSCEDLTATQLSELCKAINKASRKIATEQAIREVRAQTTEAVKNGLTKPDDSKNCMVCFERQSDTILQPCLHELCSECSTRLNFCPQCRTVILSRDAEKQITELPVEIK